MRHGSQLVTPNTMGLTVFLTKLYTLWSLLTKFMDMVISNENQTTRQIFAKLMFYHMDMELNQYFKNKNCLQPIAPSLTLPDLPILLLWRALLRKYWG